VNYLNCDRLWQLPELPESIAIIGGDWLSCTIAQALSRLGCRVTMLVAETHILGDRFHPYAYKFNPISQHTQTDVEVARLLQANLEISHLNSLSTQAMSITASNSSPQPIAIYTNSRVTAVAPLRSNSQDQINSPNSIAVVNLVDQVEASDPPARSMITSDRPSVNLDRSDQHPTAKIRIWAGDRTFECQHLLIPGLSNATNQLLFKLGLETAGVSAGTNANVMGTLNLNRQCQTSNRRIYVCQTSASIDVILQNVLFLPFAKLSPKPAIQVSTTQPAIARLGMSEIVARLSYGKDIYVLRQIMPDQGLLKILCRGNGQVIGAHGLGRDAVGIIPAIAIAMTRKISLKRLATLRQILPDRYANQNTDLSLSWLTVAIDQFERQQLQRRRNLRKWLERWFMWRRDYNL
jgi:hypothetical protein